MREASLHARWIAPPGEHTRNYTFLARKQFTLDRVPSQATLHVCADSRYVVSVNGHLVGIGPVKHSHKRYFFDSYDVAKLLKPGTNHIAAEVHCPVKATYIAAPVAPALWVQVDGIIETDDGWQVRTDPSRRSDSLLCTLQVGYSELRDLRKELIGWQTFADGGDGWVQARELGGPHELWGPMLSIRFQGMGCFHLETMLPEEIQRRRVSDHTGSRATYWLPSSTLKIEIATFDFHGRNSTRFHDVIRQVAELALSVDDPC